jgi:hypothetical protein
MNDDNARRLTIKTTYEETSKWFEGCILALLDDINTTTNATTKPALSDNDKSLLTQNIARLNERWINLFTTAALSGEINNEHVV